MNGIETYNSQTTIHPLLIWAGLLAIAFSLSIGNPMLCVAVVTLPLLLLYFVVIIKQPYYQLLFVFTLNYYLLAINRYLGVSGISFVMDAMLVLLLVLIMLHSTLLKNINWRAAYNTLTVGSAVWMVYCLAQVANPTGLIEAWVLSRGLIVNGLIISLAVSVLCTKYRMVKGLVLLLSLFTLTAVAKALIQKYVGFDSGEMRWLNDGSYKTHLLASGTRYFSFFTDAGNFGSNMGCAGVLFTITAMQVKRIPLKLYYYVVGALGIYAMFLSGTRGAMIVPLAGMALYILVSKNTGVIIAGGTALLLVYVFFAYTTIGQGNAQIRRMRTAFNPTQDDSFNVRRENQKRLAVHLKNKPFGEGLGLSGVENQKVSVRLTTLIPHDSWYVKVWVETGWVGIVLYLGIFLTVFARGALIVMFRVKDPELRGRLSALLCGIFGMFLSAYGNAFWGQFPTSILAFTCLSIVLKGEHFDREIAALSSESSSGTNPILELNNNMNT